MKMFGAAKKAGVTIVLNSGFRDFQKQKKLKKQKGAGAASPGRSRHQSGKAFDFNNKKDAAVYNWLRTNAWEYGLVQNLPWYEKEGHHWIYAPSKVKKGYYTYFDNVFGGSFKKDADRRVPSNKKWRGKGSITISNL